MTATYRDSRYTYRDAGINYRGEPIITVPADEYALYVRDSNLTRIAEIDDFNRLDLITRFNAPGTWTIELPFDTQAASLIAFFTRGIEIVRGGVPLLSGPVTKLERGSGSENNTLIASGSDDMAWLGRRLALPVPLGPPYTAASHDVRTGNAESVMRQYVDVNAGPSAKPERRVPGLTLAANGNLGPTVTGRARFDNLLTLLSFLALAGGDLGFRVQQIGTTLEFKVYQPVDRTASALFSLELGNVEAFAENRQAGGGNYIIVGGQGEGTARTFQEKGDSDSIVSFGRMELFLDRRDTNDTTELIQAADEELARAAEERAVALSPVDTEAISFGTHYGLGDRVTVMVDGVPFQQLVREVAIALDPERGEVVRPMVGTPGAAVTLEALIETPHPTPEIVDTGGGETDFPIFEPPGAILDWWTPPPAPPPPIPPDKRFKEIDRITKR